jgi:hypothetical protein
MGYRTERNDAGRVDLPVRIEVVDLDMVKVCRLFESWVVPARTCSQTRNFGGKIKEGPNEPVEVQQPAIQVGIACADLEKQNKALSIRNSCGGGGVQRELRNDCTVRRLHLKWVT